MMVKTCTRNPTRHRCFRWKRDKEPDWFRKYENQFDRRGKSTWYHAPDNSWERVYKGDWIVEYHELGTCVVYIEEMFHQLFELDELEQEDD